MTPRPPLLFTSRHEKAVGGLVAAVAGVTTVAFWPPSVWWRVYTVDERTRQSDGFYGSVVAGSGRQEGLAVSLRVADDHGVDLAGRMVRATPLEICGSFIPAN